MFQYLRVSNVLMLKSRMSLFRVEIALPHSTKKLHEGTLLGIKNVPVMEKLYA